MDQTYRASTLPCLMGSQGGGPAHDGMSGNARIEGGLTPSVAQIFLAGLVALDQMVGQAGWRSASAPKLAGGLPGPPIGQRKRMDGGLTPSAIQIL